MNGSLKIAGNYSITTDFNNLGISQTTLSVAGWIKILYISNNSPIFGMTLGQQSSAFGIYSNNNNTVSFFIQGLTGGAGYSWSAILNQWIHYAMVMDKDSAIVYLNGSQRTIFNNPSITQKGPNIISIGSNGAVNYETGPLAIWNNYKLSEEIVNNLRDGSIDPLNAPVPATSYWLCNGVNGTIPTINDSGMHDQIGNNNFIKITGSGATYTDDTPIFTSAVTCIGNVTRCGGLFAINIGTNPILGPRFPSHPTAVNFDPVFIINDIPVSVLMDYDYISHTLPQVFYRPYSKLTNMPIICKPTDKIRCITKSNWVKTIQGLVKAEDFILNNCTGGYEPGDFGYMDFNPPAEQRTFIPGFGGGSAVKQIFNQSQNPWNGTLKSTKDGIPLEFTSSGVVSTSIWRSTPNGLDFRQFPAPPGKAIYQCDEYAPLTPNLIGYADSSLITGPTIIPGTIINGVEYNKKWEWNIALGESTYNSDLDFSLTAPLPHSDGQPVTHKKMKLFIGGDTPVDVIDSNFNVSDLAFIQCKVDSNNSGGLNRYLTFAWPNSNVSRIEHVPVATDFSFNIAPTAKVNDWVIKNPTFTGPKELPLYAVRPYDLSVSPNVYINYNAHNAIPSDDLSIAPYMIVPTNQNWLYPSTGKPLVCEFMIGLPDGTPIRHNMVSSQFLVPDQFSFKCLNSAGSGTSILFDLLTIWVTGPTTLACVVWSNLLDAPDFSKVDGFQIINKVLSDSNFMHAHGGCFEAMAAMSKLPGNPKQWFCLNHSMDDPTVLQVAKNIRASTPVGTEILLQMSNEPFIDSYVKGAIDQLSSLQGFGYGTSEPAILRRLDQMVKIFKNYWGDDADSIKLIFQPFTGNPGNTYNGLVYAQNNGIEIPYISIAEYIDIPPAFKMLFAAIDAENPDSLAHPSQGGNGIPCPMGVALDVWRNCLKYGSWNGPGSSIDQHIKARDASGYNIFPKPKIIGYEIAINEGCPAEVSHTDKHLRFGICHDIMSFNPSEDTTGYGDVIQTACEHWSCPGPLGTEGYTTGCIVSLCTPRSFGPTLYMCTNGVDNQYVTLWSVTTWLGQEIGPGYNNKFWCKTLGGDNMSHDFQNQAVAKEYYNRWLLSRNKEVVNKRKRWFNSRLRKRRSI